MNTEFEEIAEALRGNSLRGLFSAVHGWFPGASLEDQKSIFWNLVSYLYNSGEIRFVRPGADVYISGKNPHPKDGLMDSLWDEGIDVILNKLFSGWPKGANNYDDVDIIMYLFDFPDLVWLKS